MSGENEFEYPASFKCPITHEVMRDPVIADDGYTYERQAIENWFQLHHTSPMTNLLMTDLTLKPNYALRDVIEEFQGELDAKITENYIKTYSGGGAVGGVTLGGGYGIIRGFSMLATGVIGFVGGVAGYFLGKYAGQKLGEHSAQEYSETRTGYKQRFKKVNTENMELKRQNQELKEQCQELKHTRPVAATSLLPPSSTFERIAPITSSQNSILPQLPLLPEHQLT